MGDARAAVVTGISFRGAERIIETQITPDTRLMSDDAKALMALPTLGANDPVGRPRAAWYTSDFNASRRHATIVASAVNVGNCSTSLRSRNTER